MLSLFVLSCSMQILLLSPLLMQNYLITFLSLYSFYIYRFAFLPLKYSLTSLLLLLTFTLPFSPLLLNLFALANHFHNFPFFPNFAKPFYFTSLPFMLYFFTFHPFLSIPFMSFLVILNSPFPPPLL
jgi:hypothetical protein